MPKKSRTATKAGEKMYRSSPTYGGKPATPKEQKKSTRWPRRLTQGDLRKDAEKRVRNETTKKRR